jgi:hypothetical protein
MEYASPEELLACLKHLVTTAGNAKLLTPELMATLCDHALGNYREEPRACDGTTSLNSVACAATAASCGR